MSLSSADRDPGRDLRVTPNPAGPDADIFRLRGPVGAEAANDRDDVIRAQILFGHTGDYDLERLGGPTGWAGSELFHAMRRYQRRRGRTVDGLMLPDGETMASLRDDLGELLSGRLPPTAGDVDRHHEVMAAHRAAGDDAAPMPRTALVMPGESTPAWMRRDSRPGETVSDIDVDDAPRFTAGAQVAQAEAPRRRYWIPAPPGSPPPHVREQAARDVQHGIDRVIDAVKQVPDTLRDRGETAINLLRLQNEILQEIMAMPEPLPPTPPSRPLGEKDKALGKTPPLTPNAPELGQTVPGEPERFDGLVLKGREALQEGIRKIFESPTERHESPNSTLSTRIIIDECLKLIESDPRLKGFKHFAGGSDDKGNIVSEKALKNGELLSELDKKLKQEPSRDHSFPDALFRRGKTEFVAINSATESSPGRYIGREWRSWKRLMENLGKRIAGITGKKRPDESLDEYRLRARQVCEQAFDDYLNPPAETSGKAH